MKLEDYDFDLPTELIAQYPATQRDQSRLLVLSRADGSIRHVLFNNIVDFLSPTDTLVLNQTQVVKARLRGRRVETGGEVEVLLIRPEQGGCWLAMGRPGRGLAPGTRVEIAVNGACIEIVDRAPRGRFLVRCEQEDMTAFIEKAGEVPLPPYIRRRPDAEDGVRYQTVFARHPGAIAAPTAGLHFTGALLEKIAETGTAVVPLTLHVGPGSFEPVRSGDPRGHHLESEYYDLSKESAAALRRCKRRGGRIVAVGTTVVRTLETVAEATEEIEPGCGWTEKFILPSFRFRAVDALVTNFHLPRSSLLLLVAAFAGRERVLEAYKTAVAQGYRFYSYGDAMLIV